MQMLWQCIIWKLEPKILQLPRFPSFLINLVTSLDSLNSFGRVVLAGTTRIFYYITLCQICQAFSWKNIAQIFSQNFVHFAYCFFLSLVIYYKCSKGRAQAKRSRKKIKKIFKNLLTKCLTYDIITMSRGKGTPQGKTKNI